MIVGYVVQRVDGGPPSVVHASYDDACAEAERLSRITVIDGSVFVVVEICARAVIAASTRATTIWQAPGGEVLDDEDEDEDDEDENQSNGYEGVL